MAQTAPRLYIEDTLSAGKAIALTKDQAHYLGRVLRKEAGADVLLFNGQDGEWLAEITDITKNAALLTPKEQTRGQAASPDLHLLFAPVKRAPLDLIAQKATELGVSYLQPVRTERTIVTRLREDRLEVNAIEAAEQCERVDVPEVGSFEKLTTVLNSWADKHPKRKIIFCDEAGDDENGRWGGADGRAQPMTLALQPFQGTDTKWAILLGPEGGFTPAERETLRQLPFVIPVTLGPRILRADTAAFAAITLWQSILGDFTST